MPWRARKKDPTRQCGPGRKPSVTPPSGSANSSVHVREPGIGGEDGIPAAMVARQVCSA